MERPLHPIELKVLSSLRGEPSMGFDSLVSASGLLPDQVRRSLSWLSSKGLVRVSESSVAHLSSSGRPPELVLVGRLKEGGGSLGLQELKKGFGSDREFSAAMGRAARDGWVETGRSGDGQQVVRLKDAAKSEGLERLLAITATGAPEGSIPATYAAAVQDLLKRGLLTRKEERSSTVAVTEEGLRALESAPSREGEGMVDRLTPGELSSGRWRDVRLRPIDVEAPAPVFHPGRRHPVREFINEVREVYLSMGFTEITGASIQSAFWNFDALFTPQDHPARELQDTFYVKGGRASELSPADVVERVASAHEDGWRTGSRGWRYRWDPESARRLVLRTHNTALTIRATADSSDRESRVFSVGRVYRNENLDYKHLAELHQMEGIIIGEGLNVRHLMGFLSRFYSKLGMSGVKLWPSYFPYTEPSLQVMTYYDKVGRWLEMGGSGIFRPEVTWPLGVRKPVLAWGCGLERLLMLRLEVDDIRQLYDNDLGWLRRRPNIASGQDILR